MDINTSLFAIYEGAAGDTVKGAAGAAATAYTGTKAIGHVVNGIGHVAARNPIRAGYHAAGAVVNVALAKKAGQYTAKKLNINQ